MRVVSALLALGCAGLARAGAATASPASTPEPQVRSFSRKRATAIVAANRKIVTPNGIEELLSIPVNGIDQWLSIRGRDRAKPILLYLHGGPGAPMMPEAWTFQSPWEDYFTVVQWDQRGAGKTYASNDPKALAATMHAKQMIADAEAVARYLLNRFEKKKLFVLGHSWGSYLGIELALRHPSWLYAYVGTGQIIDMLRSEAQGYAFALDAATAHENAAAIKELKAIAPYPGSRGLTFDRISAQRKWLVFYGGTTYGRSNLDYDSDAWRLSPEYTEREVALINDGGVYSVTHLLPDLAKANFEAATRFECPVFMFTGRHDYTTSHIVIADWFRRVRAPQKGFVWFENSAHMPMLEEPGKFCYELVSAVRSIESTG